MGTCEQRDTGQGHPDKGTGQRTDDYLQIHGHFCWTGRMASQRSQKERYVRDSEKMPKLKHFAHSSRQASRT